MDTICENTLKSQSRMLEILQIMTDDSQNSICTKIHEPYITTLYTVPHN